MEKADFKERVRLSYGAVAVGVVDLKDLEST